MYEEVKAVLCDIHQSRETSTICRLQSTIPPFPSFWPFVEIKDFLQYFPLSFYLFWGQTEYICTIFTSFSPFVLLQDFESGFLLVGALTLHFKQSSASFQWDLECNKCELLAFPLFSPPIRTLAITVTPKSETRQVYTSTFSFWKNERQFYFSNFQHHLWKSHGIIIIHSWSQVLLEYMRPEEVTLWRFIPAKSQEWVPPGLTLPGLTYRPHI